MKQFRRVLGPKTDCEFRRGAWCSRTRVEVHDAWLDDIPNCRCVAIPRTRTPIWGDLMSRCFTEYKKRGTEQESYSPCL